MKVEDLNRLADEDGWHYDYEGNDSDIPEEEFKNELVYVTSEDGMNRYRKRFPGLKEYNTAIIVPSEIAVYGCYDWEMDPTAEIFYVATII